MNFSDKLDGTDEDKKVFENMKKGYVNFFKEFFKQNPSLLKDPINCDLICQRIEEYVRVKNQQYLEALDVKMDGKNVLIDIKSDDDAFVKKDITNKCIFCGCHSRHWKYINCPDDMRTYCSDCKASFLKYQLTKEV